MGRTFTPQERAILAIAQKDLPDSPAPYAAMAQATGTSEAQVISFLRELLADGVIRRFGASIRHQRTGWNCNIMVAWALSPEQADEYGQIAARHPNISHAYYRPCSAPDWPYTFYTMIHGRNSGECQAVIDYLRQLWPQPEYAALRSMRELKKSSMVYFPDGDLND